MRRTRLMLLSASIAAALGAPAFAGPVFGSASYSSALNVPIGSADVTPIGIAYSGGHYYTAQGGHSGSPMTENDLTGSIIAGPQGVADFRGLSSDSSGVVYAKLYGDANIYTQTAFGSRAPLVTLSNMGNGQEAVVYNPNSGGFVGINGDVLQFWNSGGAETGDVALSDGASYQSISVDGDYALEYSAGVLKAYDLNTGALTDQTQLLGLSANGVSEVYGQGYANGYFFVGQGGFESGPQSFVGFQIGTPAGAVPEPATWAMLILGVAMVGFAARRRDQGVALAA